MRSHDHVARSHADTHTTFCIRLRPFLRLRVLAAFHSQSSRAGGKSQGPNLTSHVDVIPPLIFDPLNLVRQSTYRQFQQRRGGRNLKFIYYLFLV